MSHPEEALLNLKPLLCFAPIVAYPVPGEKLILDAVASNFGISEIDGSEKVIAYFSKSPSKAERNY